MTLVASNHLVQMRPTNWSGLGSDEGKSRTSLQVVRLSIANWGTSMETQSGLIEAAKHWLLLRAMQLDRHGLMEPASSLILVSLLVEEAVQLF